MKKTLLLVVSFWLGHSVMAQTESVGPITSMSKGVTANKTTRASNPIDSSWVYIADTLNLPLFDDFSSSKFQTYDAQPGDPNVTEQLWYQLLDELDVPLSATAGYTTEQTYRYVTTAGDTDTIPQTGIQVQIGDFSEYPVVYATTTVYPPYHLFDTTDFVNDIDTTFLTVDVLQDSALIFTEEINDPEFVWMDSYVYRNYTLPLNPWSIGVATFDGLDETGYPYNFGSSSSGVADFLTSKPIDLSGLQPGDSIYFSFVAQPQGLGDEPESTDSLVLEFYDATSDTWDFIWSMTGTAVTDFQRGHIRVVDAAYFTDAFRFRFKNYGGLSGALDHFHVDYVHLRTLSGYQDSVFKDFAWSYPAGTLLKDYTQVPWDHYKNNFAGKMTNAFKAVVHNGWNVANNNALGGKVLVDYNSVNEGTFIMNGAVLSAPDINYEPFTTYSSLHDFSAGYHFDETKPGDEVVFDITGVASGQQSDVFLSNDSCHVQQVFADCYAYDDGSAEAAYGPTGVQARLAYKFTPYESDSLIGVKMCFVPSVNDVSDKLFLLSVWDDNGGVPGAVIYEDEFFFPRTPQYEGGFGVFTTYYLKDTMKLPIDGTFYVGWRQIDADRLNIGMDKNNDNSDKIFYSINGGVTWVGSSYDASLLMRPVFSTAANADLSVSELAESADWEVYPNPTNARFTVAWNESATFPGAVCTDAQGRVIQLLQENEFTVDLSEVPSGIYFVRLNGFNHPVKKVIRL